MTFEYVWHHFSYPHVNQHQGQNYMATPKLDKLHKPEFIQAGNPISINLISPIVYSPIHMDTSQRVIWYWICGTMVPTLDSWHLSTNFQAFQNGSIAVDLPMGFGEILLAIDEICEPEVKCVKFPETDVYMDVYFFFVFPKSRTCSTCSLKSLIWPWDLVSGQQPIPPGNITICSWTWPSRHSEVSQ